MADIMSAQAWADLANGPKESSDHDNGAQSDFVTSPCVGLCPMTPHKDAGIRIDPPVSEPMAMETCPVATLLPEPPLEPPVIRSVSQGFF